MSSRAELLNLNVEFDNDPLTSFKVKFESDSSIDLKTSFGEVHIIKTTDHLDIYDGDHIVIPNANSEVILPTTNKTLMADIKVEKIPYSEVTNLANGITATIG